MNSEDLACRTSALHLTSVDVVHAVVAHSTDSIAAVGVVPGPKLKPRRVIYAPPVVGVFNKANVIPGASKLTASSPVPTMAVTVR